MKSSEINERIWAVIARIPKGRVATYGQVAAEAGFPRQPRRTAQALRAVPDALKLPWYRVINAQGKLSFEPEVFFQQSRIVDRNGDLVREEPDDCACI